MEKRWIIEDYNYSKCSEFSEKLGVSPVTAQILVNRGFSIEEAEKFLKSEISDMYDPFLMRDMNKIKKRIENAKEKDEKILIHGDYDVDGITSTAILLKFAKDFGIKSAYFIPNRLMDGYGLSRKGIEKANSIKSDLIITVDCGTNALDEVDYAKSLGIDVLITDHHELEDEKPKVPALNPKIDDYPFKELSGAGVALKLVQAFNGSIPNNFDHYMEIAAIGTVADVVPLVDENRIIVKNGLLFLNNSIHPGINSLIKISGIKNIEASDIGFKIGPRLNAAGRLGVADKALKILIDGDNDFDSMAEFLNKKNSERQRIEEKVLKDALEKVNPDEKVIVVFGEKWHKGVIGIVSSKITEMYHRPSIVISCSEEGCFGSGRSISKFNLFEALKKNDSFLVEYGGHKYAAGIEIEKNKINDFRKAINDYANENLSDEDMVPELCVSSITRLSEINKKLIEELEELKPFGYGNPLPLICSTNLNVKDVRLLKDKHVKINVSDKSSSIEAIAFNRKDWWEKLESSSGFTHVVYTPKINNWNGKVELMLKDAKIGEMPRKGFLDRIREYIN